MKGRWKQKAFFLIRICLFLAMNWAGDQLASGMQWPVWLDSAGTVLCAWMDGPLCGAIVGASFNLLGHILYGTPWYYAAISILIAVIVGIGARKKMLDTMLNTLTASAVLAGAVTAVAYPMNLLLNGGNTGNIWGEAVIGFMAERGFPRWIGLMMAQLYVEMLDKLAILMAVFLLIRLIRRAEKIPERIRERQERRRLRRAAKGLCLLICLGAAGAALSGAARAEAGEDPAGRVNYNDYVQTVYSTGNGLPCGEANDIAMTGDGVMWIGTYAGLYRYNGREFRWMDGFESVRNVNCLYVDEEGRLWVGTNDNGLSIMINGQVVNVIDQEQGLPANSVKSIIKGGDGYYYIGTTGSMQVLTLSGGLKRIATLSEIGYADHLAADGSGYVAAVDNAGTLFLMREGQIVFSQNLTGSETVFKSCMFEPDGELLAATTGNEIYRYRIENGRLTQTAVTVCPGLSNIKNMHRMENGELFICADNGIAYLDGDGTYGLINTNDFNNSIDNMLVDYQGNLWFTSSRLGLLRLAPSDFRDIYTTAGMDNRVVNTIVAWNGKFYFGTDKGMDAVDQAGKSQIRDGLTERFAGIRIRCMIVDRAGSLWVCTYGSGLTEITQDGTEYLYNGENGAFGNRARVVRELADGSVLAAGDTGLSLIRDHRVEWTIDRSEGNISSMVLTITEREDGSILVGTDGNGLAVLENGKVARMLTRKDGLSSEVILRTVADPASGGVFIVTSNGLCFMDAEGRIRTLDNFPYFNNYDIWIQGRDELFVLSSAGIYTVNREELLSGREDLSYDLLNARRGLTGSLTANAWTWFSGETGELYLPCDTGVFAIRTGSLSAAGGLYRMNVTGYRVDGEMHYPERNVTAKIPRGSSRLEILPEVINYSIRDPYVGYMLEGFDTEWTIVPQNTLSSISYTNLPTGDFTFHLAVFDNSQSGILAERTYRFTKEKELYDNSWFIVYLLSVPMFAVFWVTWLLLKRRERKMQAQLAEAEKQIQMGRQTVVAIARTVDAKDERTSEHSKRVAKYSKMIAEAYGLDKKQCDNIEWSAQMHDIGKIGIPDAILNKNSRLTDEEYAVMKSHTTRGSEILKDFTLLDNVIEGAEYHHERYDGRGYPKGLKGEEIPLFARIIGVADAFDAMTANRVYRKQMDFGYVLGEMERGKGTQFDPQFVDILLKLIEDGEIDLKKIYPSAEESAEEKKETESKAPEEKTGTAEQKETEKAPEGKTPEEKKAEQKETGKTPEKAPEGKTAEQKPGNGQEGGAA